MGELLAEKADKYDPNFTCLAKDVRMEEGTIQVRLKSLKEDRSGKDVIVDIFRNHGDCCPVRAKEKKTSQPSDLLTVGP